MGGAHGSWSVISLPQKSGEVLEPRAVAVDAAANLYVADRVWGDQYRIQKRDAQGHWSVIASTGTAHGQVSLTQAPGQVYLPQALAVDATGNLYVADSDGSNPRIQKRDAQGNWSVIATQRASALAADSAGNLYVGDTYYDADNHAHSRIQKRDAQGNWSVLATEGSAPGQVSFPTALAVGGAGNLYVGDGYRDSAGAWLGRIQKRDLQGNWSILATGGAAPGQVVYRVASLAVDATGNLYVAEGSQGHWHVGINRIQKRDAQGNWSVIATYGSDLGQVIALQDLTVDSAGNLYVADQGGSAGRIQRRDARGTWSVLATDGWYPGQIGGPSALTVDTTGNLYVADSAFSSGPDYAYRIQKRDAQGNWSVIATDGWQPGQVYESTALTVDTGGNLYVTDDPYIGRIQKRDARGNWSVIATAGSDLGQFDYVSALAVDTAGNLYVAEPAERVEGSWGRLGRIQQRDAQANWSLIADGGTDPGQVIFPTALAMDPAGNLYVAEASRYNGGGTGERRKGADRIQKRDAQGNWSVLAMSGTDLGQIWGPTALAADAAGNLYVADGYDSSAAGVYVSRIQKRDAQGNWSVLTTEGSDLGQVSAPSALAVDGAGNLYVADPGNNRVLKYTPAP